MIDVRSWLSEHGFKQHADLFEENEIDGEVLLELTNEDLKDLGLALGTRKKLLRAISSEGQSVLDPSGTRDAHPLQGSPDASRTTHDAERRQLTVMFVDLVASTALAERLDPEEMRDVITTYQNTVAGVVSRYEGMVAKYMGDGALAYFGWPRAHEDDAERAVRAAQALMQAMNGLAAPSGEALQARAGIATGLVVVGDLIGEGAAQEEAVIGETPNLAARLQDLAEPGQVVIADSTQQLTGDAFELHDLGTHALKGIGGNTPAFAVTAERTAESRLEARLSGSTGEMVGRGHELGLILERWQQAKKADGQLLLLTGEAGIGKSRIARAVIEATAGDDHTRISYQCSPYHSDSALYPAIQQLVHVAGITPGDSNDDMLDKLEAVLTGGQSQLIAALLDLSIEDRYGPLNMDPQQQRRQTLKVLAEELIALSKVRPVLFILEDAHWIDATTLEMIELCLDQMPNARILVLVTARPTFEHRFSGHPIVTQLALNRLSREQISAIVLKLAGGKPLPEELLEEIAQKTDGVPLFVEELTKTVLESKELTETDDKYELNGPLSRLAIPATLHDSLMARLDRLQPVKEVAQMAACIGREFEFELLGQASALNGQALQAALEQLVSAELIFRRGMSSTGSYIFKHALVRDAAYESLLKTRRSAIHGKLLDALEQRKDTAPELLAHHATQAGQIDKAIDYWHLAGEQTRERSAVIETIAHLTQALTLLLTQSQTAQRDERELELQTKIGSACIAAYGYGAPATITAFDRGFELSTNIDRPDLRFPILYGQYVYRYIQGGGTVPAQNSAKQLLDEAELQTDRVPKMVGHRCVAMILYCQGQFTPSQKHYQQTLELYQPENDHRLIFEYGTDSMVSAQVFLASITQLRGFPDQADKLCTQALEVARRTNHIHALEYGLFFGPIRQCFCRRDLSAFERHVAELAAIADEHKLPMWQAYAATQQGWCAAHQGRHSDAITLLLNGLKGMKVTGVAYDSPMALGQLAEAYLLAGQFENGLGAIDQAIATVQHTNERWFEPEIYRLKGELVMEHDGKALPEAKAAFHKSLELSRAMDARWWELRTAASLARMPADEADKKAAFKQLQSIYDEFTEGFECADLQDAKALLDHNV
jgi:class 3 adenylate cyclase/predicted ATPase